MALNLRPLVYKVGDLNTKPQRLQAVLQAIVDSSLSYCTHDKLQPTNIMESCTGQYMSRLMRKPTICICENKDADQLCGYRKADQRLCFRYTDSTLPFLLKSEISSF